MRSRWAVLPLRIIVGYGFLAHGAVKWSRGPANFAKLLHQIGVPRPTPTAYMVTLVEVFGGVAILVGAFVALVSIPLVASMPPAAGIRFDSPPTDQASLWREARLRDPAGNALCLFRAGPNRRNPPWRVG